jgi:hypothetical protein
MLSDDVVDMATALSGAVSADVARHRRRVLSRGG